MKSVSQKVTSIATKLGEKTDIKEPYGDNVLSCKIHSYKDGKFEITYLWGFIEGGGVAGGYSSRDIDYNGEKVYEEKGGRVKKHSKGRWEEELELIYQKALQRSPKSH